MGSPSSTLWSTGLFGGSPPGSLSALKVSNIIYRAYRIAGILANAKRGYSPEEEEDGLEILNSMVDGWKAERLMVWGIARSPFDIQASKQTYTIGRSGADFTLERPERIEQAGFIFTNVNPPLEVPLRILTPQEWAAVSPKTLTSTICSLLYYEPLVPNGNVILWPVPTTAWQICLYTWQTLDTFATVSDPLIIPPAYQEALEYNLAVRFAENFPTRQKMSASAMQRAARALAKIKSINAPVLQMQVEAGSRGLAAHGHWDIFSNQWRS
ncbi:MAG: hypothetical protein M1541_03620, partial [Acidobacteria bacterium]|nr:hypothetical protein [Acidobacteriota bacterium]